jgi:hypothetical protein
LAAILIGVFALSALGALPATAASIPGDVYFGSGQCPAGITACPSPDGWPFAYPYGTGGGYKTATRTIAGQNSFSPVTAGGSTVTDIIVKNITANALTNLVVKGGTKAPTRVPRKTAPKMPARPLPSDRALCKWTTGACIPSLPAGLNYQAVEILDNAASLPVDCALSATPGLAADLYDGLACTIGTVPAGASVTLRIVVATSTPGTFQPWFSVRFFEPYDDGDYDLFMTYGKLTVGQPSCSGVSSYVPGGKALNLSNTNVSPLCGSAGSGGTSTAQSTTISSGSTFPKGVFASVGNVDSDQCLATVTCFGQLSVAHVAGGAAIPGGLTWTITWAADLLPPDDDGDHDDARPKGVIHFLDGYPADPNAYEQIKFRHSTKCGTEITGLCWVSLTHDEAGNWTAVIESPSNGAMKGF